VGGLGGGFGGSSDRSLLALLYRVPARSPLRLPPAGSLLQVVNPEPVLRARVIMGVGEELDGAVVLAREHVVGPILPGRVVEVAPSGSSAELAVVQIDTEEVRSW
jgi:hypothetical protein